MCSYFEFLYVDTLSIFSPLTAASHVVVSILNFLLLHCGYLGASVHHFIVPTHWHLENLSYIRKQQEQPGALNETISSRASTVKACSNFLPLKSRVPPKRDNRGGHPAAAPLANFIAAAQGSGVRPGYLPLRRSGPNSNVEPAHSGTPTPRRSAAPPRSKVARACERVCGVPCDLQVA